MHQLSQAALANATDVRVLSLDDTMLAVAQQMARIESFSKVPSIFHTLSIVVVAMAQHSSTLVSAHQWMMSEHWIVVVARTAME